ncbi:hypothetical protein EHS17_09030 [Rhodobacteraceae bacterium CH30]|nr:hypothetical protein EHS17_09030 [Rhodobacteraceae bacterium CH30]
MKLDNDSTVLLDRAMNEMIDESYFYYLCLCPGLTKDEFWNIYTSISPDEAIDHITLQNQAVEIGKIKDTNKMFAGLIVTLKRAMAHGVIAGVATKEGVYLVAIYHAIQFRSVLTCVGTIIRLDSTVQNAVHKKFTQRASDAGKKSKEPYMAEKDDAHSLLINSGRNFPTLQAAACFILESKKKNGIPWMVGEKTLREWISKMPERNDFIIRKSKNNKRVHP